MFNYCLFGDFSVEASFRSKNPDFGDWLTSNVIPPILSVIRFCFLVHDHALHWLWWVIHRRAFELFVIG